MKAELMPGMTVMIVIAGGAKIKLARIRDESGLGPKWDDPDCECSGYRAGVNFNGVGVCFF